MMSVKKLICFTFFVLSSNLFTMAMGTNPPVVTTTYGPVLGKVMPLFPPNQTQNILSFEGIPYAKPPLAALRFSPGNAPIQAISSEDCLYLNIYSSNLAPTNPAPVMVFIHGGSFVTGSGAQYPGQLIGLNLVSRGVVVVTINYRLGAFGVSVVHRTIMIRRIEGFLGAGSSLPGNWGLYDQILALQFVKGNIGKFGDCTTLKAWNGGQVSNLAACLRNISAAKILTLSVAQKFWSPLEDGPSGLFPSNISTLAKNRNPNISTMIGTNRDESMPISSLASGAVKLTDFNATSFAFIVQRFTPWVILKASTRLVRKALGLVYGGSIPAGAQNRAWLNASAQFETAEFFLYPSVREAQQQIANNATTYLYRFDYYSATFPWPNGIKGVIHTMELPFIFPQLYQYYNKALKWTWNTTDYAISNQFGIAWTNFAKTGDPNKPTALAAKWKPATAQRDFYSISATPSMMLSYGQSAKAIFGDLVSALKQASSVTPVPPSSPSKGYAYGYVVATWVLFSILLILCILLVAVGVRRFMKR